MKIYKISFFYKQFSARPYGYDGLSKSYYLVVENHQLLLSELANIERHYTFDKDKYRDFAVTSVEMIAGDDDVKLLQK